MTTEEHDEQRVRRAVVDALEGLEGPDRARLARIEQRLLAGARRHRSRHWWWMVAGLGLAAGATAAYWVMDPGRDRQSGAGREVAPAAIGAGESPSESKAGADIDNDQTKSTDGARDEEGSPVIYIGE